MKIYELTTNEKDGFRKLYVVGIKSDEEARRWAKRGFGSIYYWENGISFYDRTEDAKRRKASKYWVSKSAFIKLTRKKYGY